MCIFFIIYLFMYLFFLLEPTVTFSILNHFKFKTLKMYDFTWVAGRLWKAERLWWNCCTCCLYLLGTEKTIKLPAAVIYVAVCDGSNTSKKLKRKQTIGREVGRIDGDPKTKTGIVLMPCKKQRGLNSSRTLSSFNSWNLCHSRC